MSDEVKAESAGISELVIDSDDKMFQYAMDVFNKETENKSEDTSVESKPEDQPAEEVKEEKEEPADETKVEPQVEEKAETSEPDTAKPEIKKPYTPEEIKEIAATGDFSKFDSSRLTPGEQAAVKSMQSGLTPKLQRAAEIERNYNALLQKELELAKKNAEAEAERKYQEEKEQYGDEMANLFKKVRDLEAANEEAKIERERERQAFLAEQQKVAAQRFHLTFVEKCKEYGIPNTPQMEELVMSKVLAENRIRELNGEPFISIEDGMKFVADVAVPSDIQRLESLLAANPKLAEALKSKYGIAEPAKAKPVGPTVIKSSSGGGGGKSEVKPSAAPHDKLLDTDAKEWMVQQALSLLEKPNQ